MNSQCMLTVLRSHAMYVLIIITKPSQVLTQHAFVIRNSYATRARAHRKCFRGEHFVMRS